MSTITRAPLVVRRNRRFPDDRDQRLAHHGWFHHWRTDRMLAYKGLLAFDFLNVAAANPGVLSIEQRARPIHWWDGSAWVAYRPRYQLTVATASPGVTRRVDVEVLPTFELAADRTKYRRIQREMRDENRSFLLFTELQLRAEPRLTNARLILMQAGDGLVPDDDLRTLRQVSDHTKRFTLNELVEVGVLPYGRAYAAVLNLVARGEISFRPCRRFDGDTPLFGRA